MTNSAPSSGLWQRLVMPEEERRNHSTAPSWDGGYRWFRSINVVDLQQYRSPAEKERIRAVLLCRPVVRSYSPGHAA